MLIWLAEHASFVYFAIVIAAVAFGMQYWLYRRLKHLALFVGLLGLLVATWLLFELVPTDRRQIADNLQTMGQAVMDGNAKTLFRFVSKDFVYSQHTGQELYGRIDRTLKQHKVRFLKIWDIDARPEGDRAKVDFYFRVDGDGEAQFLARGKSDFVREQNVWKMKIIAVFPVAGDREMQLPLSP
ncbi:MAG: hypothetical protein K2X38_05400 [Gemmataceae bacterium]|nr:hypothetical protein [Gemmataceae bacterium]